VTGDLPLQTNTGFTVTLDQPGTFVGLSAFTGQDTITISSGTVTAAGLGSSRSPTPISQAIPGWSTWT
jgi:hypothetical protein